ICAGGVAVLTVSGCTSMPQWYAISAEGLIPVWQGPIFDAIPQQSTCYVVICCNPVYPQCCDTDTVCVNVKPLPVLSWPSVYSSVCQNGGQITLNPADVFVNVNNIWVVSPLAGGSGYFSGPGIFGNTFTPPGIGSYLISFTYTDPNGCSTTIYNSITVIYCCDPGLQVNAGNDTVVCAGSSVTLTAAGCNGNASWYSLGIEGPEPIGQGGAIMVTPQQNTCYMVICCNPQFPACCDTDTVCITVKPVPVLTWPTVYTNLCVGGGSFTFNPADILVWVNNSWVPSTQAGGFGYYTGQGMFGNVFTPPPGQASYLIDFTYTFPNGCTTTVTNSITVVNCCTPPQIWA
ncbi:MAG: hypothetical protein ACKOKF_06650, partial [Bacteroidota bacterium]